MQSTSKILSNRSACPHRVNICGCVAFGVIASIMMLNISNGNAQERPQAINAQASIVTNADNYRSSERMNQTLQTGLNITLPGADSDIAPTIAAGQDPAAAILGDGWHQVIWQFEDTWITDIGTLLYRDDDGDGYFSGFSLTIDADTHYQQADIYASIDIQRTFGERERLHTSGNFTLYENSLSDEYRIDIDLLKNYPAGDYNLYLELHDAYDHRVLDSVGAAEFTNLYRLPLESEDLDVHNDHGNTTDAVHYPDSPQIPENDDIRVVEYAGSSGLVLLLALLVILYLRKIDSQTKLRCRYEW